MRRSVVGAGLALAFGSATAAAQLAEGSPEEAAKVGGGLWQRRKHQRAAIVFEALAQRHPSSATAWMNLAMNYRALGRTADADAARKRALELDPLAGFIRSTVTALDAQTQKTEAKGGAYPAPVSLSPDETPSPQ